MIAMNKEKFNQFAMEGEKPVLVEFGAPWCVYCRRIGPAMEQVAKKYAESLPVFHVNIDDEEALAKQEHIEVVPTLIVYHKGEVLGSIVAPESRARIEDFIADTVGI